MDKKKRFILKQSCISELRVNYIDNLANDLQLAIQATVLILKQLSIGAKIVPLAYVVFGRKISVDFRIIDIATYTVVQKRIASARKVGVAYA